MTTLQDTQGSNAKKDYITANHTIQMKYLFEVGFSPYIVTGVSKVEYNSHKCSTVHKDKFKAFVNLVEYLVAKNINAADRLLIKEFLEDCSFFEAVLYSEILTKKWRMGINAKSINKALGYDLIPLFNVMLAEPKKENKVGFPCIAETKYDGVRIIIRKDRGNITAFTRKGKSIVFAHLFKALAESPLDNFVFDGEVVNKADRLKTTSTVNKLLKGNTEPDLDIDLDFYVFDGMSTVEWDNQSCELTQTKRSLNIEVLLSNNTMRGWKITQGIVANSEKELNAFYQSIRNIGGEGIIVKKIDGLYEFKRSTNWLKAKAINTCTMKITGLYEGDLKNVGKLGGFNMESACGSIAHNVGSGFSDDDRVKFWELGEVMIHNFIEVQYNELQYKQKDNTPYLFLPIFKEVRLDKTEADTLIKIAEEEI